MNSVITYVDTVRVKKDLSTIINTENSRNYRNIESLNTVADYIKRELKKVCDSVGFQEYEVDGYIYKNTWRGPDPGHTFVTLEMNDSISSTSISQSFGFYPSVSVNPYSSNPSTSVKWKDNGNYTTNISISQDLDLAGFMNIINFVNSQSNATYNLNTLNCTDMGIKIAAKGGLILPDTSGTWGVGGITAGSGTNPGDLGEDIRDLSPNPNINVNSNTSSPSKGECN